MYYHLDGQTLILTAYERVADPDDFGFVSRDDATFNNRPARPSVYAVGVDQLISFALKHAGVDLNADRLQIEAMRHKEQIHF